MLKKKLVKLAVLTLGLGGLIALSRPARAIPICCSDCDTLYETCIENFPDLRQSCVNSHTHCEQICVPGC
jgi:hypothetical protein